jgi:hypothetical protein
MSNKRVETRDSRVALSMKSAAWTSEQWARKGTKDSHIPLVMALSTLEMSALGEDGVRAL